ncbi:adenylate kinase [Actinosynnema sp. NPDC047251]|uniref:Adenylate kinase n=1 Tax=Saccharothrix espanaensis (strain ATCC 51144 / DSM 44229 / JCM 9112 / NBRC 15066 / NRRL 15764) TaxID=1179773 RepID=K0KEF0_SACES|nr:adenylate kinase [Saccharothrix espanaensis]CCH35134.1 Adenylate kinase [Saccharothrix espanaensis DSM 44229]
MRLVLVGPPGAGKGTQAQVLSTQLGVPHISTGDLFRAHISGQTELGREVKKYLDEGKLVPDSVTIDMVRERLAEEDTGNGFLLDGFPRTTAQADVLTALLTSTDQRLDAVLELDVPEDVVVGRLLARGREDDKEDVIRHRQQVYRSETAPLLDYYRDILLTIDAVGSVDEITERALKALRASE